MKFQAGDRFKVKENGITGQIYTVFMVNGETHYGVLWDTLSRRGDYPAKEVDDLWENLSSVGDAAFVLNISVFDDKEIKLHKTLACQHEWADYVGFNECFQYCKKCDMKVKI